MNEKYSEEFGAEAVSLALSSDQPYSATALDLGVNCNTLYTWIIKSMSKQDKPSNARLDKRDYQELLKQNRAMAKELKLRK
jgi:transposase-like protein